MQGVSLDFHVEYLRHHVPDALYSRVAELEKMIALFANHVVVLPETVAALVFGLLVSELMTNHQIAIHQEFERIVDCGTGNRHLLLFQANEEFVSIEMVCRIVDFFEDDQALLRLAKITLLKIVQVTSPDDFELFFRKWR